MSWTHSSKVLAVGVLLALALGAAGTATAVTFDASNVPEDLEVGTQPEVSVTMEDPFENQPDTWEIQASSQLDSATVTIRAETVGGDIDTQSGEGSASMTLSADDGINEVVIEATGTVPEISNDAYNYQNPEEENFVALQASGEGVQEQWEVHRYTEDSREARQKIDEAAELVSSENSDLQTAISLYDSGDDFGQATSVAEDIISGEESEEQTQTLLLGGAAVVVLIALAGGGYYVYSQRKKNTNKLQ